MRKYIVIILVLIGFSSIAQTPPRTGYLVQPAKWKFVNPIWLDSGAYITKISKTSGQNRYLVYDSVKGAIGYRYATTIDTTSLSNRINLKLNISDTAAMLSPYLKSAVTSVGLSMPNAFSVANSPITSTGTIAVTGAGTAAQYIRGDGQLATLPSGASGGSSVNYYLNGSVNQGTIGGSVYYEMNKTSIIGAGTDFALAGNGLISQFITDVADPNRLQIPAGNWNFEIYMSASSSGGTPKFYVELLKYDGTNFTSIASSSANPEAITNGTTIDLYLTALAIPQTTLLATDRLAIRVYIVNSTGGRTITMHTENSHLCEIITNFAGGVSALNGLTANTQYLAVGTSGNDFAINSLTDTHTFNLPTASSTKRGALSSTDWSTFNGKMNYSDTVSLSNRINLRVKYTDTSSMLSKYLRAADTLKLRQAVNLRVKYTDTSTMLSKYLRSADTLKLSNRINLRVKYTDTSTMLSKYLRAADTLKLSNRINLKQNTLSLTTTGSSGAATLVGATLNIPQYSGGVTSVTGTAPVVSSGGTTPAISMAAATTFVDGYLTSTDWTTFNNKGSGTVQSVSTGLGLSGGTITTNGTLLVDTASASIISRERAAMKFYPINSNPNSYLTTAVTSVAALTLGTSGTDLSSTVANGTTTPVITLNVPTASAVNRGALSSTDWSTFNGKESILTFSRGLSRSTNTVRLDTSKSYLWTAGVKLSGLSNTFGQSRVAVIDSVTGAVGYKYISSGGSYSASRGLTLGGTTFRLDSAITNLTYTGSGAVSKPVFKFNGTFYSGGTATTTKPMILIEPSGTTSTGWNTSGTLLGINATDYSVSLIDLQRAGGSKFKVVGNGTVTFGSASYAISNGIANFVDYQGDRFIFSWGTKMKTLVDGNLSLTNFAETSFGRLQFGGTTSSFPSLKRSTTTLQVRLADDSGDADLSAATITSTATVILKGYTVATLPTGTVGMTAYVTNALAPTYGAAVVGGGAVIAKVFYNGTSWITD